MKKLFFSLFSFFAISPLFSQITTLSDAELGFGFETAILRSDLKKTYNTGIGGSAKFAYNFTDKNFALTFQAGMINFSGKSLDSSSISFNSLKEKYSPLMMIPVKIGARMIFAGGFYAEPQLGGTMLLSENLDGEATSEAGFTFAFNVGYHMLPGIDIGARYESISTDAATSFIGVRIAYSFTFRRQEIY